MPDRPVILVVDDDAPIVALMRNLLREFGFEPVTAMTGRDALATAREMRPQLVLLDRNMPGMSGEDVIRELRSDGSLSRIPILILSGKPVDRDEITRLGADGAVQKPFTVTALIDEIRRALGTEC